MRAFVIKSFHRLPARAGFMVALCLLLLALFCPRSSAHGQEVAARSSNAPERTRYSITLDIDVAARTYTGTERLRWINSSDRSTNVLYFHLYSNMRQVVPRGSQASGTAASNPETVPDEPRLEIMSVRSARTNEALPFVLEDQGKTLRVMLRESVAAGGASEIFMEFRGSVPEIDADETGLLAHLVQQVGAVLRGEREMRRARDMNFNSRGVLLLGASYPILAAREGDDWQRKIEQSIGDPVYADVADYRVEIRTSANLPLFTSGEELRDAAEGARVFTGENMRSFAIIAGRGLRAEERSVSGVTVRSIFLEGHEAIGRRVLGIAAEALRAYTARFGPLPFKSVTVAEAPLVAGHGAAEFSSFSVIASAFYVDFDSPTMRNLPEIVREQRASLEDSLEFTVAHVVAHQWWGMAVGNDPERSPVLDEALANWSALLYYKEVHGPERAETALDDQLRGVYKIYRTFGGEDMEADRAAREYRNSFQYSAIVSSKGALMFAALRRLMGDEKFFAALRSYYNANRFEVAELDDLRGSFIAEAPIQQRRTVARTFSRWLSQKRGDQD
ncbi:MAG TPA: M1 family aminopeptidase, partial [Pyrinomonadaceae bacterium]|nr:M1 family aminopeptidase [Pyrinomonadaceae bacterium]